MSGLSGTTQPVAVRPRRSLGGLYFDIVVEERHTDDLEITEHPVEQGANVADHAYLKPKEVVIHAAVSNSSVGNGDSRAVEMYEKLLELQGKREPFDVVTGKRLYRNMLISSLSVITDKETEHVLDFTATCREVILVSAQTVAVPASRQRRPGKTQATADKGEKQAQPRGRSALSNLFGRN